MPTAHAVRRRLCMLHVGNYMDMWLSVLSQLLGNTQAKDFGGQVSWGS